MFVGKCQGACCLCRRVWIVGQVAFWLRWFWHSYPDTGRQWSMGFAKWVWADGSCNYQRATSDTVRERCTTPMLLGCCVGVARIWAPQKKEDNFESEAASMLLLSKMWLLSSLPPQKNSDPCIQQNSSNSFMPILMSFFHSEQLEAAKANGHVLA